MLYSLQVWWNCDPFSILTYMLEKWETAHLLQQFHVVSWKNALCYICILSVCFPLSWLLLEGKAVSEIQDHMLTSCGPLNRGTLIMAVGSCMVGLWGEHTLADLCCESSETLWRCFCPSSCSLIFTTVQSGLCTPAFCNPYSFQSSGWWLAAKCGWRGKILVPLCAGWDRFLAKLPLFLKKKKKKKKRSSLLAIHQRSQLSCRQAGGQPGLK